MSNIRGNAAAEQACANECAERKEDTEYAAQQLAIYAVWDAETIEDLKPILVKLL